MMTHADDSPQTDTGQEFARLLTATHRRLYAFVLTLTANPVDADDIMQETSSVLWRKFSDFTPGTDFASWAMAVARNIVMQQRQRQRRQSALPLNDDLMDQIAETAMSMSDEFEPRREALHRCMTRLKDDQRRLIRWRYEQQQRVPDIAGQLGVTKQAVYKSLDVIHALLLRCIRRAMAQEGR